MANIGGGLIAILAFIALLNSVLAWFGALVGIEELTFEYILGLCFIPLAWLLGVPQQVRGYLLENCYLWSLISTQSDRKDFSNLMLMRFYFKI